MDKVPNEYADLLFSCPPYGPIERYYDKKKGPAEGQLSAIEDYDEFLHKIELCAQRCWEIVKPSRFVVWVVGDFRWKGKLRSFHSDCIRLFEKAGFQHWDTIISILKSPFVFTQQVKVDRHYYTAKTHEFIIVMRRPPFTPRWS